MPRHYDTVAGHIDTHIGRGFIRTVAVDLHEHSTQHRENFHVAVIVYSCFSINPDSGDQQILHAVLTITSWSPENVDKLIDLMHA